MKINLGLSRAVTLSLLFGAAGSLVIATGTQAQVAVTPTPAAATTSTTVLQVIGTASPLQTGLKETINFSGPLSITTTVLVDPALPASVVVSIDGRGVIGVGATTKTVYHNECEANLTRQFAATDVIKTTFAFFENKAGSYLFSKTGLLTLSLTYSKTTMTLTKATATIGAPSVLGAAF
jgi:hypothetical protein